MIIRQPNASLTLTLEQQAAKNVVKELERAEMSEFPAKDVFRGSGLSLLGVSNSHVEKDRAKIILNQRTLASPAVQGPTWRQAGYR